MSLVDGSSKFTYSGFRPVVSPCGKYVAYLNGSKLVIRSTDALNLIRIIKFPKNNFIKVTQISWEPIYDNVSKKIAVLIDNENKIKIYDITDEKVDISITEDDIFGIENFEWLPKGQESIETAYEGSKQLVVFTKNNLYAKVYSLDYSEVLMMIEKPKFNRVLFKPNSNIFSILSTTSNGVVAHNLINNGSSVSVLNSIGIDTLLNISNSIEWSPNGEWLLCYDSVIGEIKLAVFPLFSPSQDKNEPLFKYRDQSDPLGAIDAKWVDDKTILLSDHHENIHQLSLTTGLSLNYIFKQRSEIEGSIIWKRDGSASKFTRKQQGYKLPRIEGMPLHLRGVSKFLVKSEYLFVVTKSMPGVVFIWNLSETSNEPAEIIITNSRVREILVPEENHNLLLIINDNSISLWHNEWTSPLNLPYPTDEEVLVKGASFANVTKGSAKIVIWSSDSFYIAQFKLSLSSQFEDMDSVMISTLRNGSPALIDDSSRVVELANGVQQSEWGHNHTNTIQLEDTFMNRKPNKASFR